MDIPDDSPISNATLDGTAERISKRWRTVRKRAPKHVRKKVRELLEEVYAISRAEDVPIRQRIKVVKALEDLEAELRGRQAFVPQFYQGGRLAIVRAYDPIKIRGAVDHQRIALQFDRYLSRAEKAIDRLNYFFGRAGLETEERPALKPWEQPYASFEEYHELLWGRVSRGGPPPGGQKPR